MLSRIKLLRHRKHTHVLRLPFPSSSARLQLEKSLAEFREAKQFNASPSYAHIPVSRMEIRLGQFYFQDPEQLLAARGILRAFDFASSVKDATATPLSVTLKGLTSGAKEQRENTQLLFAAVLGTPWLDRLGKDLAAAFERQKLPYVPMYAGYSGARFAYKVPLVNVRGSSTGTLKTLKLTPSNKGAVMKQLMHDIYPEYVDRVWVHNLPLDRICLSTRGLKALVKNDELIYSGYENILSVPLPGAPDNPLEAEVPAIKYVKSTVTLWKSTNIDGTSSGYPGP